MTTSHQTLWKSASSIEEGALDAVSQGYFVGMAQNDAHELVLKLFSELSKSDGVTRAAIAKRLHKSPEQITRWLSAPGNWTLETLSLLLLAMGHRPHFSSEKLDEIRRSNQYHPATQWPNIAQAVEATVLPNKTTINLNLPCPPKPTNNLFQLSY